LSSLPVEAVVTVPKRKRSLLPVLIALFVFSYGLLTTLVVEQGRTIENQRGLITALFSDTVQLTSLKIKIAKQNYAEHVKNGTAQAPAAPSHPSTAVPPAAPNANGAGKTRVSNNTSSKVQSSHPVKPPKVVDDAADARRIKVAI
jgi:hypothetical protein